MPAALFAWRLGPVRKCVTRWSFDRFPYGREISRAIADPAVREVVICASSQIGKSELATLNPILTGPQPIGRRCFWSVRLYKPAVRSVLIVLTRCFGTVSVATANGNSRKHGFIHVSLGPGCRLSIVAGLSAVGLAMRPVRFLILNSLCRLPLMAKGRSVEGDCVALAKARTSTFCASAKVMYSSSPIELESCRISALYEDSSEEHYYSRCPAGHYQILALAEMNFESGCCRCVTCERQYSQAEWLATEGVWRAHGSHPFWRGFHLACWPSPLIDWRTVHAEWRQASHQSRSGYHSALRAGVGTAGAIVTGVSVALAFCSGSHQFGGEVPPGTPPGAPERTQCAADPRS
jgi:hypothetical protein